MATSTEHWVITVVVSLVTGVGGFLSNTLFRKKELDQKGFELLFQSLQTEVRRLQDRIVLLERKIEELEQENDELRSQIANK